MPRRHVDGWSRQAQAPSIQRDGARTMPTSIASWPICRSMACAHSTACAATPTICSSGCASWTRRAARPCGRLRATTSMPIIVPGGMTMLRTASRQRPGTAPWPRSTSSTDGRVEDGIISQSPFLYRDVWRRIAIRPRSHDHRHPQPGLRARCQALRRQVHHHRGLPPVPRCRAARACRRWRRASRCPRSQWQPQCAVCRSPDHHRAQARGSLVVVGRRDRRGDPCQRRRRQAGRIPTPCRADQGRQGPHDPHSSIAARPTAQLPRGRARERCRQVQDAWRREAHDRLAS